MRDRRDTQGIAREGRVDDRRGVHALVAIHPLNRPGETFAARERHDVEHRLGELAHVHAESREHDLRRARVGVFRVARAPDGRGGVVVHRERHLFDDAVNLLNELAGDRLDHLERGARWRGPLDLFVLAEDQVVARPHHRGLFAVLEKERGHRVAGAIHGPREGVSLAKELDLRVGDVPHQVQLTGKLELDERDHAEGRRGLDLGDVRGRGGLPVGLVRELPPLRRAVLAPERPRLGDRRRGVGELDELLAALVFEHPRERPVGVPAPVPDLFGRDGADPHVAQARAVGVGERDGRDLAGLRALDPDVRAARDERAREGVAQDDVEVRPGAVGILLEPRRVPLRGLGLAPVHRGAAEEGRGEPPDDARRVVEVVRPRAAAQVHGRGLLLVLRQVVRDPRAQGLAPFEEVAVAPHGGGLRVRVDALEERVLHREVREVTRRRTGARRPCRGGSRRPRRRRGRRRGSRPGRRGLRACGARRR